jgi:hypothetical protein
MNPRLELIKQLDKDIDIMKLIVLETIKKIKEKKK